MPVFLNNCRRREHASLFNNGSAFYDLNTYGRQATMARNLRRGTQCVVATPTEDGEVVFDWFSFARERTMPNPTEEGAEVRVFFGELIGSVRLAKSEAAETEPYCAFFNVLGHFKRPSVPRCDSTTVQLT
jgi:hypothetical protein